jgi:hypothetical protein
MAKDHEPNWMAQSGEWTLVTLRIYLEALIKSTQRTLAAAMDASEKAIGKAEQANEKRFEAVNEFRSQLNDQTAGFIPRVEYDSAHQRLQDQVNKLGEEHAEFVTRAENNALHARTDEQINELKDRLNKAEGKGAGYQQSWLILVAVISTLGVLVGIFVFLSEHH